MKDRLVAEMFRRRIRGSHRAWKVLARSMFSDGCVRVRNKYNVPLALDPADDIDLFILREGYYESEVFDEIHEIARGGGVFWDIGANNGLHSVTLAKLVPAARVVSFEPSPREIFRIARSALCAGVTIEILPFAVSNELRFERFHLCDTNAGRNSLIMKADKASYCATLASCITGDHLCFELGYELPSVIKIDVEGAEEWALSGMRRVLSSKECRRIIFEARYDFLEVASPVSELLDDCGFSIRALTRNEASAHNLENFCADK